MRPDPGAPRVNVAIIDEGLNEAAIKARNPDNWGGGLEHRGTAPGTAEPTSHGMMMARNILDIVPDAVLYDVPMLPKRGIADVSGFASDANATYLNLVTWIQFLRLIRLWSGPWVLVNGWAVFDRASERDPGDYTENKNPSPGGHPLNKIVGEAGLRSDVVFAAGNCGPYCPDGRCGALDVGPSRSIWGANSHKNVITVGAVVTAGVWLGYSSQGPGQPRLSSDKPDLCAPSHFCETTNSHVVNTGTSAACALTAGVVAALRRKWDPSAVTPEMLRGVLKETARKPRGPESDARLGHGILNAGAAYAWLSTYSAAEQTA
jgi:hypothetical protein